MIFVVGTLATKGKLIVPSSNYRTCLHTKVNCSANGEMVGVPCFTATVSLVFTEEHLINLQVAREETSPVKRGFKFNFVPQFAITQGMMQIRDRAGVGTRDKGYVDGYIRKAVLLSDYVHIRDPAKGYICSGRVSDQPR